MSNEGTVRFNVVAAVPGEAGPVVEIRDHNLALVDRARPGGELDLEAGLYLASVVLPSGDARQQGLEVKAGETIDVDLAPGNAALAEAPLATRRAALAADLPQHLVLKSSGASEPSTAPDDWSARVLWASSGTPVEAGEGLEVRSHAPDDLAPVTDLGYRAPVGSGDGLMVLQVAAPRQVPFNCLLPVLVGAGPPECRIRVVSSAEAIRATALPAGGPLIDSVAAYVVTGHLRQAAHVVANARDLLHGKIADPIGAALGAYALLRLGRLDEVNKFQDWVHNLANWFPALPDGAVIAAEQAARCGDAGESKRWLREAIRRGAPVFADGLSLLVTRVRPDCSNATPDDAVTRILDMATLADFAQLVVAYPGADPLRPADTQRPAADFPAGAGWLRFHHGQAVGADPAGA